MPLPCRAPPWSRAKRFTAGGIAANSVWTVADGECAIQMLVNDDVQLRHRRSQPCGLDLQQQVVPSYGVVLIDDALVMDGKDTIQIVSFQGNKRRALLCRRPRKPSIESPDIELPQKIIGGFRCRDASQP